MAKRKTKDNKASKGERPNVNKKILNAVKRDRTELDLVLAKLDAFKKGKRVMITIANPSVKSESNKPFIRVNANDIWKRERYIMKSKDVVSL